MCRHRFRSELTCEEVWYRLNILLQSFAVCGAKRCEVRGELTAWGCYLWLRGPEGRGGTPVPLRLWTEEEPSSGCVICGSFLPAGRELWGLLLGAGGLCLEVLLADLIRGVPLLRALAAGLGVGCIAAAVLYFFCFKLVRFFSRKREAELLRWIRKYLLLREPEGVLLPDAETQRSEWVGLSKEEMPTMKRRFVFRCALPPEELPAAMETWLSRQGTLRAGVQVKWSVKWRGLRFKLSRTEIEEGQREAGSLKIFAGWFKTWQYADPFCGAVEPDGQGGSILRGSFHRQPVFFLPWLTAPFVIVFCLRRLIPPLAALPLFFFTAACAVLLNWRTPFKNPGSRRILEFLETHFEEV